MFASLLQGNRAALRVSCSKSSSAATIIITATSKLAGLTTRHLYPRNGAACLFSARARMSKSGSSTTISARNNSIDANKKKQQKESSTLPTERQKTLNKFLGLPLEQRQTRVDSLFKKQLRETSALLPVPAIVTVAGPSVRSFTTSTSTSTASERDQEVMQIDASSDVEQVNTVSKANGALVLRRSSSECEYPG